MDKDFRKRFEALMVERGRQQREELRQGIRPDTRKTSGLKNPPRLRRPVKNDIDPIFKATVAANIAWEVARTKTVFRKMLEDFFKCPDYDWWGNC